MFLLTKLAENDMIKGGEKEGREREVERERQNKNNKRNIRRTCKQNEQ